MTTPESSRTDPLIFPVGHYAGAFYRREGSQERDHHVLVGTETVRLSDEQLRVWLMARGAPDEPGRRWTREAVEELARRAGVENAPRTLDELGELRLIVATFPGTEHAIDFAETYRVVPLLLGLGNTPEEPWQYGIGLFDQPLLTVSHEIYGLWEWAHVDPNLWAACYSHADVAKRAGATDPDETDPERILTGFLETLHPLLAAGAAYLDLASAEAGDDDAAVPPMATRSRSGDALVFPVGHYVGAYHPEVDAPLKYRNLRVGVEIERLTDEREFAVWALTHGLPDRVAEAPWTRDAVLQEAEYAGVPDPVTVLDRLIARGLVAQVDAEGPEILGFAAAHRVQPLLHGLGNSPDDLSTFGIGFLGLEPLVELDALGYEIWQWGRLWPNLWVATQELAAGELADEADLRQLLAQVLRCLHRLLAGNASYLDVAFGSAS